MESGWHQIIPVILSGGSGTRLWPVSRAQFPKQFAPLLPGGRSLFDQTLERLKPLGSPWTVTTSRLKVLTEKALDDAQLKSQVLYEPKGRNTAPAIAFLVRALQLRGLDHAVAAVFPADHVVKNVSGQTSFEDAVRSAADFAAKGEVVTLGVQPTHPATGYGYIETSEQVQGAGAALIAKGFREKPELARATEYVASGRYLWNAGMFVFKVSTMADHLQKLCPEVWTPFLELKADLSNAAQIYDQVPNISIDYAVMEKLKSHVTIPCPFSWSDVGSWDAISEAMTLNTPIEVGARGNLVFGQPDSDQSRTVAVIGADDLIVVDTADALLIAKKGQTEKVKQVTEALEHSSEPGDKARSAQHRFEVRPWGKFEILRDTQTFKSKVITVDPGAQISYQSHAKRAEHWIIVSGYGEVVLNDEVIPVSPGTHIHIPLGAKHRIRNTGRPRSASASVNCASQTAQPATEPIVFVEVQLGTYFGEDDIVRYEDVYGRIGESFDRSDNPL